MTPPAATSTLTVENPAKAQNSALLPANEAEINVTAPDSLILPHPGVSDIEGIPVAGFINPVSLFERLVQESRQARLLGRQYIVNYLNIHVANTAFANQRLKMLLQQADLVYCDGAGIVVGSRWLGTPLPTRLTAADWFIDMLQYFAKSERRIYLLGGKPGVPEQAIDVITRQVPGHSVVGAHHGFILKDDALEAQVIEEINATKPDILIVGFGTPLQEEWVARNRHRLDVPMIYAIGAVMDFVSGAVPRCPDWMGQRGLEWLYRLMTEPGRLGGRYVIGNPWFLGRIAVQVAMGRLFRRAAPA